MNKKLLIKNGKVLVDKEGRILSTSTASDSGGSSEPTGATFKQYLDIKGCKSLFENSSVVDATKFLNYEDTEGYMDTSNMFKDCYELTNVPDLDTSGVYFFDNMFENCRSLKFAPRLKTENAETMNNMFSDCHKLKKVDISYYAGAEINYWCYNCHSLKAIIIRHTGNGSPDAYYAEEAFTNCYRLEGTFDDMYNPEELQDCYIYVPRDKINIFKMSTFWFNYKERFRALEDYTLDGTLDGVFDDEKAGLLIEDEYEEDDEIIDDEIIEDDFIE